MPIGENGIDLSLCYTIQESYNTNYRKESTSQKPQTNVDFCFILQQWLAQQPTNYNVYQWKER